MAQQYIASIPFSAVYVNETRTAQAVLQPGVMLDETSGATGGFFSRVYYDMIKGNGRNV